LLGGARLGCARWRVASAPSGKSEARWVKVPAVGNVPLAGLGC
jgi:hypothetical protein